MSRATLVYIFVLLGAIVGVTIILKQGETLTAPPDVSGAWTVGRIDAASPAPADTVGRHAFVEQSGRFIRMTFENGLQLDAKLLVEPGAKQGVTLRFRSRDWELTAEGKDAAGPLVCQLIGSQRYPFTLSRPRNEASPTSMPVARNDAATPVTAAARVDTDATSAETHAP